MRGTESLRDHPQPLHGAEEGGRVGEGAGRLLGRGQLLGQSSQDLGHVTLGDVIVDVQSQHGGLQEPTQPVKSIARENHNFFGNAKNFKCMEKSTP